MNRFFPGNRLYRAKMTPSRKAPRTLLDNSMLLLCSSMLTGNHNADQLPVILLGGGGGRIRRRVWIMRTNRTPDVPSVFVYDGQMDVRQPKFGDATKPLLRSSPPK